MQVSVLLGVLVNLKGLLKGLQKGLLKGLFESYSNFVFVGIGREYIHFGNWHYKTEKWVL